MEISHPEVMSLSCPMKKKNNTNIVDQTTCFTKEELKIIGNLCETMKHWRRHNPDIRFPDTLYEQFENIQDKCTRAIQVYNKGHLNDYS
jgi:hypothetical protein